MAVSLYFLFTVYCPYKYITQKICDEAVNHSLAAIKLISDEFVTSKMIKKPFTISFGDENLLYFNEDSGDTVFNYNEMGITNIDVDNIKCDDNFDEIL